MDEFDISEVGTTKHYYVKRKRDGKGFTCIKYYDSTLDYEGEIVEAHDGRPVTKEEEEAVKKAVQEFFQK